MALFARAWKKIARNFFQRLQNTTTELLTFPAIWQRKCTLPMMESYLTREVTSDSETWQAISFSFFGMEMRCFVTRTPNEEYSCFGRDGCVCAIRNPAKSMSGGSAGPVMIGAKRSISPTWLEKRWMMGSYVSKRVMQRRARFCKGTYAIARSSSSQKVQPTILTVPSKLPKEDIRLRSRPSANTAKSRKEES